MKTMNKLTPKDRSQLRAQAHKLQPVVIIGQNGATDAVLQEIDRALTDHELVKIKVPGQERDTKHALAEEICLKSNAKLISVIGRVLIIYRKNLKAKK